jgi:hypothetical protein
MKYEAILTFTQSSRAKVVIEADSIEDAQAKADEIQSDEVNDWNPIDGNVYVESVEPAS